jgi:hypothetical protein
LSRQGYWNGLLAGGLVGALLGIIYASNHQPQRKLIISGDASDRARKVMRGISRGVGEMLRH